MVQRATWSLVGFQFGVRPLSAVAPVIPVLRRGPWKPPFAAEAKAQLSARSGTRDFERSLGAPWITTAKGRP